MDNSIFRAPRMTVSPEEVEQVQQDVDKLDAELSKATGMEPADRPDYATHAAQVEDLSNKIIDIFEGKDYSTLVALDALEAVLRGGVTLTLGEEAGELIERHLQRFHRELAAIQIIGMIKDVLGGGEKKESLAKLLEDMKSAGKNQS